jgi:hypothetical protein
VWPLVIGEKARPIPRPAPQGYSVYGYPYEGVDNTRTEWDWYVQWPGAVPIHRPAPVGGSPFVPAEATVDNTTNRTWPLAQGEKARPVPRVAPQGHHLFVPREATLDNTTNTVWPLTQGEKARPISRAAKQGHHLFVPAEATSQNTTNRVWPLTQGEKARPVPRAAQQGHHLFVAREATRENTTNTVWPLTQGEKARPVLRPAPQGGWFFGYPYVSVDNNVTIDKWQQPLSKAVAQPHPPKTGATYVQVEFVVDNTGTVDTWLIRWPDRMPRVQPQHGRFVLPRRPLIIFEQSLSAEIELSIDIHDCGCGTAAEVDVSFADEVQAGDAWTDQEEQVFMASVGEGAFQECSAGSDVIAFQEDAFQVCPLSVSVPASELIYDVQGEQSDPWAEQGGGDGDWEEQDECGR